jgi:choline-sulfatase
MMRFSPILILLLAFTGSSLTGHSADKANILVLFSDGQAVDTIRALGDIDIDTPSLDHLVARGTTLTHADNTWIVLASNHGLAIGRRGLFGKQNMYEHSLRVPFVVVGPGVAPGRRIATPIYLQDMMATSLELAGVAKPEQVFFKSLLPQLRSENAPAPYAETYGAYRDRQRAIVHGGYKLISYPTANVMRLYHLAQDPDETRDLANDPGHQAVRRDLEERLCQLQTTMDDPLVR